MIYSVLKNVEKWAGTCVAMLFIYNYNVYTQLYRYGHIYMAAFYGICCKLAILYLSLHSNYFDYAKVVFIWTLVYINVCKIYFKFIFELNFVRSSLRNLIFVSPWAPLSLCNCWVLWVFYEAYVYNMQCDRQKFIWCEALNGLEGCNNECNLWLSIMFGQRFSKVWYTLAGV